VNLAKKCWDQTLFILAWPIMWHRLRGYKFTTEFTRGRQSVKSPINRLQWVTLGVQNPKCILNTP